MNFKFWFLLFLSVFLPVAALAFWGFRSVEGFQRRSEASAWKKSIKSVHAGYFEILEEKALFLKKSAEQALAEKQIQGESPFYALILKDSRRKPKKLSGAPAAAWPMALGPPPKSQTSGSSPAAAGSSGKGPSAAPAAAASLSNPSLSNPSLSNPNLSNPSLSNPSLSNPSLSNSKGSETIYLNFEAALSALRLSENPALKKPLKKAGRAAAKTGKLSARSAALQKKARKKAPADGGGAETKSPLQQLAAETLFRLASEIHIEPAAFGPAAPSNTAAPKDGESPDLTVKRFYIFPSSKTAAAVFSMAGSQSEDQAGGGKTAIAFLKDKSFFALSRGLSRGSSHDRQPLSMPHPAGKRLKQLSAAEAGQAAAALAGGPKRRKGKKAGEAFLINKWGQLVFHTNPRRAHEAMPLKSSLLKSIKARKGEGSWFLKIKKKDGKRELFYIKKWPGRESFLAAKQSRGPFVFQGSRWLLEWGGAHGLAALLIFLMASLTARPLAGAYSYMKSAFIHIGKTGRLPPFQEKSKNPFLSFYGNWRILVSQWLSDRKKSSAAEPSKPAEADETASFQSLARGLAEKLKPKYPGLEMKESFRSDVRLWGFEHSMKMILRELFLNAIEAMGGSQSQKITVSSRVESDQFVFSVRDCGPGAAKEEWGKMLQLYHSTKSQLGAGLNVADALVRAQDGRLRFSSPAGGGLEVQVFLPMKCFLKRTALESALKEPSLKSASFAASSQPDDGGGLKKRDSAPAPEAPSS